MSASVATAPSPLKSAPCESQFAQQLPEMHAKKAAMSVSVPMAPSWLKSALPQPAPGATAPIVSAVAGEDGVAGLKSPTVTPDAPEVRGGTFAVNRKL